MSSFLFTTTYTPNSSVIDIVYYDEQSETMLVVLNSGTRCGYSGVSKVAFQNFKDAPSAGSYWNTRIKPYFYGLDTAAFGRVEARPSARQSATQPATETKFEVDVAFHGNKVFTITSDNIQKAVVTVEESLKELLGSGFEVRSARKV